MPEQRKALTDNLQSEGYLKTRRIIKAFMDIPREEFVLPEYRDYAYADQPLPIGCNQTISAPHMVAVMTELLEPEASDKVLEIGTGSGYQAAVLSRLVRKVYTIELERGLTEFAKKNLERAGVKNVKVIAGDGSRGLPEHAPFDKIVITCGVREIPEPLVEQLKDKGIIVAPVGSSYAQTLVVGRKKGGTVEERRYFSCVFVPMRH